MLSSISEFSDDNEIVTIYVQLKCDIPLITLILSTSYLIVLVFEAYRNKSRIRNDEIQNELSAFHFEQQSVREHHFSLTRLETIYASEEHDFFLANKPSIEKVKTFLEPSLIVFQIVNQAIFCYKSGNKIQKTQQVWFITSLVLWIFLFFLVFIRMAVASQSFRWLSSYRRNLWTTSLFCYILMLLDSIKAFDIFPSFNENVSSGFLHAKLAFWGNVALLLLIFTGRIEGQEILSGRLLTNSSLFSLVTFNWVNDLIWKARKQFLTAVDLQGMSEVDNSIRVFKNYRSSSTHQTTFLAKLLYYFRGLLFTQLILSLVTSIANFVPILFMQRILNYISNKSDDSNSIMWYYASVMFVSRIVSAICHSQVKFLGDRATIHLRSILISEIYFKTLRLNLYNTASNGNHLVDTESSDKEETSDREKNSVTNVMSIDVFKVAGCPANIQSGIEAIFMVIIAITMLYRLLGWSAIAGGATLLCLFAISFKLAILFGKHQSSSMKYNDDRTTKISEALNAITFVKAFCWEYLIMCRINSVREKEICLLKKKATLITISHFLWFINPTIVSLLTFSIFLYVQEEHLTVPIVFTTLSLFSVLKTPLDQIAGAFSEISQSMVSLDRIYTYLNEVETNKYDVLTLDRKKIGFENATLFWSLRSTSFQLKNISIDFKLEQLNVILGPTGSGKSALLLGLLGELALHSGKIIVPCVYSRSEVSGSDSDTIAYCPQVPWLLNETVRENILFGQSFDKARYDSVVSCCCLEPDLKILAMGDQTRVGDRGVSLSGGQRQRISLARAVYSSSKHLILDDCLSAVDPETAQSIYRDCICGSLMIGRTRIVATHNVALLAKDANWVVVLKNGKVDAQGTSAILEHIWQITKKTNSDHPTKEIYCRSSLQEQSDLERIYTDNLQENNDSNAEFNDITYNENKMEGAVDFSVYDWYSRYLGGWKRIAMFGFMTLGVYCIDILQVFWVRYWISKTQPAVEKNESYKLLMLNASHSHAYYLFFYSIIGLCYALFTSSKMQISFFWGIKAAEKIFETLLSSIIHATFRFHSVTPVGRIMNRFSKDMDVIDQQLIRYLEGMSYCLVACASTLVLIALIEPYFLLVSALISIFYIFVARLYIQASRELKRIDSINLSHLHQSFSETLRGVVSIRAFGDELRFMFENLKLIDLSNKPFFYLCATNQWIAFRVDIIGALVIFFTAALVLSNTSSLDSGLAAILLTLALSFTDCAQWLVNMYSIIELSMSSVERIKEYTEVENELLNSGDIPSDNVWPGLGKLEMKKLCLRYAPELPRVLDKISFIVQPKEKIAIVGRTGAGKSSLLTAFYRFVEAEEGSIIIDGVDISKISLKTLRQSLTLIPQSPTLFAGTIRSNLDPENKYSDEEIFKSLVRVNLLQNEEENSYVTNTDQLSNMPQISTNVNVFANLMTEIDDGGSNFSEGQKQLLCLARSLLCAHKIVLLDEATASIDFQTEAKIQEVIRDNLSEMTLLTIAHRLRSVIDYDKILLMDKGQVKEYDQPYSLMLNENSMFYQMCKSSGEWDFLFQSAKKSFKSRER